MLGGQWVSQDCSGQAVTLPWCLSFSRGWGLCLDDPPAREVLDFPLVPPGVLYDVGHQCRLQYGAYSTFCDDMDVSCGLSQCLTNSGSSRGVWWQGLCTGRPSPCELNLYQCAGPCSNHVLCKCAFCRASATRCGAQWGPRAIPSWMLPLMAQHAGRTR